MIVKDIVYSYSTALLFGHVKVKPKNRPGQPKTWPLNAVSKQVSKT